MTRLIFISNRTEAGPESLDGILQVSHRNNLRDGLGAALIHSERHFMQVMEGEAASLKRCFQRIMQDPRHEEVRIVSCRDNAERLFAGTGMFRVEASAMGGTGLDRYLAGGLSGPGPLPREVLEHLCGRLARGTGVVPAGSPAGGGEVAPGTLARRLDRLRRVRWAAWHVIGANLRAGSLDPDKLEQLRASVGRQQAEAEALRRDLEGAGSDPELRAETEGLCAFFDDAAREITRNIEHGRPN